MIHPGKARDIACLALLGASLCGSALADTETLTGDWGGRRAALAESGLTLQLDYTGEVLGNLRGGLRRGAVYEGLARFGVTLDLERALGLPGLRMQVNGLQIHGQGFSEHYVGNFLTTSGIEAVPATRLYTAWIEQDLFGGLASLRVGELVADEEFGTSDQLATFYNATYGWMGLLAATLPANGPTYPLGVPGARLRLGPWDGTSVQFGLYNGDPAGGRAGNGQRRNLSGALLPVGDDAFMMAEVARREEHLVNDLPATFKLGGWFHTGQFQDLAQPAAADRASPPTRRNNGGVYGVADVMLWRPEGAEEGGLGAFLRYMASPGRRSRVDAYLDAGLTYTGLPGRPQDVLGLAFAYAGTSGAARRYERGARLLAEEPGGLDTSEAFVELTYAAQVVPGLTIQPMASYVWNPGAQTTLRNAVILGLRTSLRF